MGMKDAKTFILRDSRVRDRCRAYINALDLEQEVKYVENEDDAKGDKVEQIVNPDGKVLYKCTNEPDPIKVKIEPYKKNRSLAQNNLMWMWLTEIAKFLNNEHGIKAKPEDLKVEFQGRWLGYKTCVHSSGGYFDKLIGTSELTTPMFTEFLNQMEIYANSELGMQLPHPEDMYYEAMRPDSGVIR